MSATAEGPSVVDYVLRKIAHVQAELDHLKHSDFPNDFALNVIQHLEDIFAKDRVNIAAIGSSDDYDAKKAVCLHANVHLSHYHPFLGILLRSTNVRNSFEVFDPLLRLAQALLWPDVKVILSSEWEYSPFTVPSAFKGLSDVIFVGLPAAESKNLLVLPLAGHELGHSVWRNTGYGNSKIVPLKQAVAKEFTSSWREFQKLFDHDFKEAELTSNLILLDRFSVSFNLLFRQCEEVFCDIMGVRLFGAGYLRAFEYLIAPNIGEYRAEMYPKMQKRVEYMARTAAELGFSVPREFAATFTERGQKFSLQDAYLLARADAATDAMVGGLIEDADKLASAKGIKKPDEEASNRIYECFKSFRPAEEVECLGDVINAGWSAYLDAGGFGAELEDDRKFECINALMLKTIEVMEFKYRTRN